MSRDEIAKLMGGYATGTLTPEERQALFEAALEDQALFDELALEQPLEELLSNPAARAHVLAALDDEPLPWNRRVGRWVWEHSVSVASLAGLLLMAGYVLTQVHLTPVETVRMLATEPNTVEVTGEAPGKPRQFDMGSLKRPASVPDLPPPPAAPGPAITRPAPALLALAMPRIPAPPAPVQQMAEARPAATFGGMSINGGGTARQNFTVDGIVDLANGSSGQVNFVPAPARQEVVVSAAATPAQTASSENSRLVESSQIDRITMKGRDLFGILQTIPGVAFGNNLLSGQAGPAAETSVRALYYQGAAAPTGPRGMAMAAAAAPKAAARTVPQQGMAADAAAAALVGTVTDPGGAAVPNALVQAIDAATGSIATTRSNPDGAFRFNGLPPARYNLVVAGNAGFKMYFQAGIDLARNEIRDLGRIALTPGSLTEEVSVTAAATPVQTVRAGRGGAGATFGNMQLTPPLPPARYLGVRYQILRLLHNGNYEPAAADGLAKGDSIKLRFTPNMRGYLYVAEAGAKKPLVQTWVEGVADISTPVIKAGKRGPREFLMVFSAQERTGIRYDAASVHAAAASVRAEAVAQENTTYVVSTSPAPNRPGTFVGASKGESVSWAFTLDFK